MTEQAITSGSTLLVVTAEQLKSIVSEAVRDAVASVAHPVAEEYLTEEEAAKLLKVSKFTVMAYRKRGNLPFVKHGSSVRIKRSDIDKMMVSMRIRKH